jgi:hypothetical protein
MCEIYVKVNRKLLILCRHSPPSHRLPRLLTSACPEMFTPFNPLLFNWGMKASVVYPVKPSFVYTGRISLGPALFLSQHFLYIYPSISSILIPVFHIFTDQPISSSKHALPSPTHTPQAWPCSCPRTRKQSLRPRSWVHGCAICTPAGHAPDWFR